MPWTPVQQMVQQWMAMPKEFRPANLRTKTALAKILNTSTSLIYRWQTIPGWWDEVFKFTRTQIGSDLAAILKSMVREALAGDVRAAKLCLEALGVHADRLILQGKIQHDPLVVVLDGRGIEDRAKDGVGKTEPGLKSSRDTSDEDDPAIAANDMVVFEALFEGNEADP